jgi:hypothetical protein
MQSHRAYRKHSPLPLARSLLDAGNVDGAYPTTILINVQHATHVSRLVSRLMCPVGSCIVQCQYFLEGVYVLL